MDLLTAVATSMLGVSRLKAAAVFKNLRQSRSDVSLEHGPRGHGGAVAGGRPRWRESAMEAAAAALREAPLSRNDGPAVVRSRVTRRCSSCTDDPPPVLWARGSRGGCTASLRSRSSGRAPPRPYALQVGRRLAAELAERGMVVVSGLARGVDSAAHAGCLDAGGETVAVLGSGLDRIYPPGTSRSGRSGYPVKGF